MSDSTLSRRSAALSRPNPPNKLPTEDSEEPLKTPGLPSGGDGTGWASVRTDELPLYAQQYTGAGPRDGTTSRIFQMKPEDIQREIYPPGAPIRCRWLKVKDVLANYPLKMTKLYALINQRKIRSFVLKDHPSSLRGLRLIERDSLDFYFEAEARRAEAEASAQQKPSTQTPES
jgi:hypothetical protein